jgi:CO/xanthine dehydrogenase Mo-binding subunit
MTDQLLGRSIDRLEDERFVQGHGRYVDDLALPRAFRRFAEICIPSARAST